MLVRSFFTAVFIAFPVVSTAQTNQGSNPLVDLFGAVAETLGSQLDDGVTGTIATTGAQLMMKETFDQGQLSAQARAFADKKHGELVRSGRLYSEAESPSAVRYLRGIARRIAAQRPQGAPDLRVFIVKDENVNAFTYGSGYIYINRGLITALSNEAQLAMIIAHEAAHIDEGHAIVRAKDRSRVSVMRDIAGQVVGTTQTPKVTGLALDTGALLTTKRFSRDDERQADALGMRYVIGSGYDSYEAATAFQAISTGRTGQNALHNLLASHPMSAERYEAMRHFAHKANGNRGDIFPVRYKDITASLSLESARVLHEQGRFGEAERALQGRLGAGVETADGYMLKGRLLMDRNTGGQRNVSKAIAMFEEAWRMEPMRAEVHRELGLAYYERRADGDRDRSIVALNRYLDLAGNPSDAGAIRHVIALQQM